MEFREVDKNLDFKYWLFNSLQERIRRPVVRGHMNQLMARMLPPPIAVEPELDERAGEVAAHLDREGWAPMTQDFDRTTLRSLADELARRPCHDPWHPERGRFALADAPAGTHNARITDVSDIPEALAIANSPLVLGAVGRYLGCRPTIDDVVAWWSIPGNQAPKEEQFFHRDNDAIKFVKLFIYLTDVTAAEGAHEFVRGSHRSDLLLERRKRFQDAEVREAFPEHDRLVMEGPFGTAFMEDTFCLHKGTVPQSRHRLLFQVRYTSVPSVFAGKAKYRIADSRYDRYSNRFI